MGCMLIDLLELPGSTFASGERPVDRDHSTSNSTSVQDVEQSRMEPTPKLEEALTMDPHRGRSVSSSIITCDPASFGEIAPAQQSPS